jgi:intracellular septation protein
MSKILFDYFPIILFFIAFKMYDIYVATFVTLAATVLQMGIYWLKFRRFALTHIITFAVLFLLGGTTLIFKDPIFIKWKPTAVSWVLALVCLGSQFITQKNFLQYLLDKQISLPQHAWTKLNLSWIVFFVVMGTANLYVVYNCDTATWVNFKLFGFLGATLAFSVLQSVYMARYIASR